MSPTRSTTVSRVIYAPPCAVYAAFLDPQAVATWLPPGGMRGIVHEFEGREGGAFSMSLVYPEDETEMVGKTSEKTDRFSGRFAKVIPDALVVWATTFDSPDPDFAGEMIVSTHLLAAGNGTEVTMVTENIPQGIRLEDNEMGCRETLQQLADYLGG
ncbi:ATPase [Rhizobium sp. Root708]|uniref:SRPBCC family protein n=1 Tax=Rhizobium sp. Root708 TaxID=1736592 RepID=UPI0006F88F7B|nr:SRPBCC family protein [Rhizobium sp. Root708]KRB52927.1 ATPase [Rhizobium sp. Root708]